MKHSTTHLNDENIVGFLNKLISMNSLELSAYDRDYLVSTINGSKDVSSLHKRYRKFLTQGSCLENEEVPAQDFFKVRITHFEPTEAELYQYCQQHNINLNDIDLELNRINYIRKKISIEQARNWLTDQIITNIRDNIEKTVDTGFKNTILVHRSESDNFYNKFKNQPHIDWGRSGLSNENKFLWTEKIIEDGKEKWHWVSLILNKGVTWNFQLVDKYKYLLNWSYVSEINLNWTIKEVSQFKDFIVFSGRKSANGIIHWREQLSSSEENWGKGNISSNKYINWTDELIGEFQNFWNWNHLSENEAVNWSQLRVSKFRNFISYSSLSRNKNFDWDESFIQSFKAHLDFRELIKNTSVIWTSRLISELYDRIDFKKLSQYGNISKTAIIEHEKEWLKTVIQGHTGRRNSDGTYYYATRHSLWEFLCLNKNIVWDEELLSQYIHHLSLKDLHSENIEVSTDFINSYWDYFKNERTAYFEDYDGVPDETYEDVYLREKFKNCKITNINLRRFIENEIRWWGVLCSDNFLNPSISKIINAQE